MKLSTIAALSLALAASPAAAQDDSNAKILHVVDAFLAGLNSNNADAMKATMVDEGTLSRLIYGDGTSRFSTKSFAKSVADLRSEKDQLKEVYWTPTMLVHKGIAVVWAPYSFDVNGQRSHCGIDVFNLTQIDGAWKISGIQYTVEPEGCAGR